MVRRVDVSEELVKNIKEYLQGHNLGNRGVEDGSMQKQLVGLIGELIVNKYLFHSFPDLAEKADGFDGGFDLTYNGKRIDVKTMERKSYVRPEFVNNFYLLQEGHIADIIVFCSYHSTDNILEICGWIPKDQLSVKGKYYAAGTQRLRADGTTFNFRQANYEVENKNLNDINLLKAI